MKVDKRRSIKEILLNPRLISVCVLALVIVGVFNINIEPHKAFGGVVWIKDGPHYLSDAQIKESTELINAPKEAAISAEIIKATPVCTNVEQGFCQQSLGDFVNKVVVTPAVAYKPGTPDTKTVIGYCTLCRDGTFSPSCAVGRGACSYHSGVAAYNVAEYRITPGTPAVEARPAVYSYDSKSYQNSLTYVEPSNPSLKTIIEYNKSK
jgi:hypothetical protein